MKKKKKNQKNLHLWHNLIKKSVLNSAVAFLPCTAERGTPGEISIGTSGSSWRRCSDGGPHTSLPWATPTRPASRFGELDSPSLLTASTQSCDGSSKAAARDTLQRLEQRHHESTAAPPTGTKWRPRRFHQARTTGECLDFSCSWKFLRICVPL